MKHIILAFLCAVLLCRSSAVSAEGAYAPGFERMRAIDMDLLRKCAPRPAGMGGAFTAVEGDPIGIFWNPSAALRANRLMVSGNHSLRHFPGERKNLDQFDSDTTAVIVPVRGEGVVGLGFTVPGEWGVDHMDTNGVVPGAEKHRGRERVAAYGEASGGRRASAGTVHSNWFRYSGDEGAEGGGASRRFDTGGGFSFFYSGAGGAAWGLSVKGISSLFKSGAAGERRGTAVVRVGVAYRAGNAADTVAAADVEFIVSRGVSVRGFAGVERDFDDRVFVRAGTMNGAPTYGVGAESGSLRLDYAVVKDLLPRVTGKPVTRSRDGHFLSYTLEFD
ncbi:MAG: hypothetical protein AB1742_13050 [bacterium]